MADSETTILMSVPDMEGSATLEGYDPEKGPDGSHVGWLPIDSVSFSLTRAGSASDEDTDEEAKTTGRKTSVEPLRVERKADYSTAGLLMWLANAGKDGNKKERVLIDFVVASGRYYLRYELEQVELVSSKLSYSDDNATESLVFTYDTLRIVQRQLKITGEVDTGPKHHAEYHVGSTEQDQS